SDDRIQLRRRALAVQEQSAHRVRAAAQPESLRRDRGDDLVLGALREDRKGREARGAREVAEAGAGPLDASRLDLRVVRRGNPAGDAGRPKAERRGQGPGGDVVEALVLPPQKLGPLLLQELRGQLGSLVEEGGGE